MVIYKSFAIDNYNNESNNDGPLDLKSSYKRLKP